MIARNTSLQKHQKIVKTEIEMPYLGVKHVFKKIDFMISRRGQTPKTLKMAKNPKKVQKTRNKRNFYRFYT